jgi:hypothetical protein
VEAKFCITNFRWQLHSNGSKDSNRMQLLTLFLGAALFAATSNPPAQLNDDYWFSSKFTELVRAECCAPEAKITITERSPWHYESARYWQVVHFKFHAVSPVIGQPVDTAGFVVFVYDPVAEKAELMSVQAAMIAVKAGREKPGG